MKKEFHAQVALVNYLKKKQQLNMKEINKLKFQKRKDCIILLLNILLVIYIKKALFKQIFLYRQQMAKKTSFALKQLIPEENPKTGTKYIVRKPTKGLKVAEKLRMKKYDPVLKKHVWFVEKKMPPHSK